MGASSWVHVTVEKIERETNAALLLLIGGLMASDAASLQTQYTAARLAERAYLMADAMIVARRVRPMTEGGHDV